MKDIYKKFIDRYGSYLPTQRTHVRLGDRVLRDWFAVLSVALTVFVVLVLVGVWVYVSVVYDTASESTTVATRPMPLDPATLEHVDSMSTERAKMFRQGREEGFVEPDPGRATAPVIIVDEEPSEAEIEE